MSRVDGVADDASGGKEPGRDINRTRSGQIWSKNPTPLSWVEMVSRGRCHRGTAGALLGQRHAQLPNLPLQRLHLLVGQRECWQP